MREMTKGVKRSALGFLAALLSMAMILSACGSKPASQNPPPQTSTPSASTPANTQSGTPTVGGTYIYTSIGDAKVLLPILTADTASSFVTAFVYDNLLTVDDMLNFHPGVAKSWTVDQDRIYTFKLHEGVKFHDGVEMTAEDAVFTFAAIAHPKYTGVRFYDFEGVKGWAELGETYEALREDLKSGAIDQETFDAKGMEAYEAFMQKGGLTAPDKYTFRVELEEPFAPFLVSISAYGIMPKHLLESHLDDLAASPEAFFPIGTGAFKFINWVKDDHIILERNPDWKYGVMQHPMYFDRMIIKTIPDGQANMIALETGETDYAGIQPDNYEHFVNDVKHVNVRTGMTFSYTYMGYNLQSPLFSDKRVRSAITHAINRQQIVDEILIGHGSLANSHGSPVRWDFNADAPVLDFNLARAEQLLNEAGWRKGADGILEKDGVKFAFELSTNNGNPLREQSAVVIQQALKQVGMDVRIELMEWNAFLDHVDSDQKQAYILGWSLGFDPDPFDVFHTNGGFNMMHGYSNARVDDLIDQGRKVTDQAKRADIYKEMQNILADDQVYTWLFFSESIVGLNTRIGGIPDQITPAGAHWNLEDWHMVELRAK